MELPVIAQPTFPATLPLSGKTLTCRPYLVAEDKILLMAAQESTASAIANATRNVINACVLDSGFDCAKEASVDVDWLLMKLRSHSVGEKVDVEITCNNTNEKGESCGHMFEVPIVFSGVDLHPSKEAGAEKKIELSKDAGVVLKPTTFQATIDTSTADNEIDRNISILYNSIKSIYDKESTMKASDVPLKDFAAWCEKLPTNKFNEMVDYIENLPSLFLETKAKCPKCDYEHVLKFEEPMDFF